MKNQYLRKVQNHGTGKETRIPPEICENLGITGEDKIQFNLEPSNSVVTLCKVGASDKRQSSRPSGPPAPGTRFSANSRDQADRQRPGPRRVPAKLPAPPVKRPTQTQSGKPDLDDDSDDSGIVVVISFED